MRKLLIFTSFFLQTLLFTSCSSFDDSETFTLEDFKSIKKIDAHVHINTTDSAFLEQAVADNFRLLTINVDAPSYISIEEQQEIAIKQMEAFPGNIKYATSFKMEGWDDPDWQDRTIAYLEDSFKKGAITVKVWKNIGMVVKDKNDRFVMIDDPKFDSVFEYLVNKGIPLVGHIGEPRNCWLPLEKMTTKSDRTYFEMHPEYHMHLHPEYPSYDEIISSRDHMLEKHPNLNFIGCHLGSLEWSVDELAKRFDKYPNFAVDLAERICHLQVQSQKNTKKVHDFIIKYQDRILYGSDMGSDISTKDADSTEEQLNIMHQRWLAAWQYFVTDEKITAPELDGEFNGLALPKSVVEKIFRINAEKWYPGI